MRQKLESIGSLLDRCLNRSDSGLPTVTLQLYESNEPVRLDADVLNHSGKCMVLRVARSVNIGQRASILITSLVLEDKTGLEKELKFEASGRISGSNPIEASDNMFEISLLLKGRYRIVIDNES